MDVMNFGFWLWWLLILDLSSVVLSDVPNDHVSDDFRGMILLFVFRLFFLDLDSDLVTFQSDRSNGSSVAAISSLHLSEE